MRKRPDLRRYGALAIGFGVLCGLVGTVSFAQEYRYRVCIGEFPGNCPSKEPIDAVFPCATSADDAAKQVCSIKSDAGVKVSPYKILPQGNFSGNRCGYALFLIVCAN